jgi:AraC family transcriptional regulator
MPSPTSRRPTTVGLLNYSRRRPAPPSSRKDCRVRIYPLGHSQASLQGTTLLTVLFETSPNQLRVNAAVVTHAQGPGMRTVETVGGVDESLGLERVGIERLACLIRRAIRLLESDIQAASLCLQDASTLLRAESRIGAVGLPHVPRFQSGGLARWQTKLTVEYIEENLGSKLRTRELAQLLDFSEGHFSRAFKRTFGVPPMAYVFERRVQHAKSMIRDTRDHLTGIALCCGFADQSHLNRTFRRMVGMSPGKWRRAGADAAYLNVSASVPIASLTNDTCIRLGTFNTSVPRIP